MRSEPFSARSLHVLATTPAATRMAVSHARRIAYAYAARVVLLLPHIATRHESIETIASDRLLIERLRLISIDGLSDIIVRVCVCQRPEDVIDTLRDTDTVILIGGRSSPWWPTAEQRLARRLAARGHHIVFVDTASAENAVATRP